jgi:ketosteroid isomerase-like protein
VSAQADRGCSPCPSSGRDTARAMSQENVEIVRRGFTAWSGGDATALIQVLDPDVVLRVEQAGQGVYRGHEGAMKSLVDWTEDIDDFKVVPEEFLDNGDYVVVRTRQTGAGKPAAYRWKDCSGSSARCARER